MKPNKNPEAFEKVQNNSLTFFQIWFIFTPLHSTWCKLRNTENYQWKVEKSRKVEIIFCQILLSFDFNLNEFDILLLRYVSLENFDLSDCDFSGKEVVCLFYLHLAITNRNSPKSIKTSLTKSENHWATLKKAI